MKIIHTLKDGKKYHVIALDDPNFFTLHENFQNTITHMGFLLEAAVTAGQKGHEGHKYGVLFETEGDVDKLLEALLKLKDRFNENKLP